MTTRIVQNFKGITALLLITLNTTLLFPIVVSVGLIKLIPIRSLDAALTRMLIGVSNYWMWFNSMLIELFHNIQWDIRGTEGLKRDEWYLVTCNHQSWADIPVVQHALLGKTPMPKFFLKQQLIWVPIIGLMWWALDFPFMKRYTREQVERNPALKGKDLETTRKACEKFRYTPVAIFNFMEGTRFTPEKHARQKSPYKHLLKPKAGGAAFVLGALGDYIHIMLDITICYPERVISFWDFVCGRIPRIIVDIRQIEIPAHFRNRDYTTDEVFKKQFQEWVAQLWAEKDARMDALLKEAGALPPERKSA
ncbi:acyltransferase [Hahella sp. SMD15-11]|uniref:Acyltransferase n=1 Tax=Thermohahella caldifontis TaxID=3142973 RepID=A0AB39UZ63_9GAMM